MQFVVLQAELHNVFAEPISEMAKKLDYTIDEMKVVLKKQYDGYHFRKSCLISIIILALSMPLIS